MTDTIIVAGIHHPVDIVRDSFGIPHCFARSEGDAFFAQGWVHAADRLWQMEFDRRRATGRWSELVGRRGVTSDTFFRRIDLANAVKRDLPELNADTRSMLGAYTAGVNAFVSRGEWTREFSVAGVEPEPWEDWHSLLVARVRHVLMGSARSKLWRSVVAGLLGTDVAKTMLATGPDDNIACVPPGAACGWTGLGDDTSGSNNWVLAGARTYSGAPLLAGDPHREIDVPNVYAQGHVACPEWDVLGIGIPGVPGFSHFGHNHRVAWSITHAMADDQDLYEFEPGSQPVTRTESIRVRGDVDVDVDVVTTPRGPMITDTLALCWTATAEVNLGFDALPPMLRAGSVQGLFECMRPWVEPVNNLLAADVDGRIGYLTRGRLPRRRRPDSRWLPVSGSDPAFAWNGWVDFDAMPRAVDPVEGYLFSANNPITPTPDPYIGVDFASPWRARRIADALAAMDGATPLDMAALHRDVLSLPARRWVDTLRGWPPLEGWDGRMDEDSTAAAAYSVFRVELMRLLFERSGLDAVVEHPSNRVLPGVVPEAIMWRVADTHARTGDRSLLGGLSWAEAISEAIRRADDEWTGERWGHLHATLHRHPLGSDLDPPRVPFGGDLDTVMAAGYIPTHGLAMRSGAVARYVFDLADWDACAWVVPLGASGEPASPHAYDQQECWRMGTLVPAPYSRAAIDAAATARLTLTPATAPETS